MEHISYDLAAGSSEVADHPGIEFAVSDVESAARDLGKRRPTAETNDGSVSVTIQTVE